MLLKTRRMGGKREIHVDGSVKASHPLSSFPKLKTSIGTPIVRIQQEHRFDLPLCGNEDWHATVRQPWGSVRLRMLCFGENYSLSIELPIERIWLRCPVVGMYQAIGRTRGMESWKCLGRRHLPNLPLREMWCLMQIPADFCPRAQKRRRNFADSDRARGLGLLCVEIADQLKLNCSLINVI